MAVGSIAFSAPEGSYFFVMDLNLQRPSGATSNSNPTELALPSKPFNSSVSASNSNTLLLPSNTTTTTHQANPTGSTNTPNNLITGSTTPQNPIVQLPAVPGIPANADVSQNLVAPPLYPCSLATVIINFPSVPPPNPFPHPGFLTAATKYARSKDHPSTPDLSSTSESNNTNEQTDSNSSSADDPASSYPSNSASSLDKNSVLPPPPPPSRTAVSPIKNRALTFSSTLSSLSNASRNGTHSSSSYSNNSQSNLNSLSSRPRAAFKGTTSTFIKSSEGLPLPQSLIKTFYASSSDSASSSSTSRDEGGEERTFAFYTWNKSLTFVQLSPPRPSAETLVRLTFAAFPTHVSVNHHTASATSLDVVIGFSTGDLIYFDPFCARYTRLNKSGCISGSAVSKIVWLAPTMTRRDGHFVSSHVDGTMICWDKEREDWNGFVVEPWPKFQSFPSTPHPQQPSTTKRNKCAPHPIASDPRGHDILISGLSHGLPSEKRNRLNPVYHWKVSQKAVTDFALSPDSKFCAIVSEDGCLRIIDTYSEKLVDTYLSYFGALLSVCWSSDGRLVLTGGQDDLVTVYSLIEQRVIARCQGHASFVTGLSFDPWFSDERSCRFASVSEDCKLIFWDLSRASLAKPRLQQINSSSQGTHHVHGASRRHSLVSNTSSPVVHHHHHHHHHRGGGGGGHKNIKAEKGLDSSVTLAPSSIDVAEQPFGTEVKARDLHAAPGRNEVAMLQPVMVKEIGCDPLSTVHYHRRLIVVASRTAQISVFGRPTPPALSSLHSSD